MLGPGFADFQLKFVYYVKYFIEDVVPPSTNSLGLPLLRQANAGEIFHVLEDDDQKTANLTENERDVELVKMILTLLVAFDKL